MDRAGFWVHEMMTTIISIIAASVLQPQSLDRSLEFTSRILADPLIFAVLPRLTLF